MLLSFFYASLSFVTTFCRLFYIAIYFLELEYFWTPLRITIFTDLPLLHIWPEHLLDTPSDYDFIDLPLSFVYDLNISWTTPLSDIDFDCYFYFGFTKKLFLAICFALRVVLHYRLMRTIAWCVEKVSYK